MLPVAIYNQFRADPQIKFLHNFDGVDGGSPLTTDETGNHTFISGTDLELSTTAPIFGPTSLINVGTSNNTLNMANSEDFDVSGTTEFCLEMFIVVSDYFNNHHIPLAIDGAVILHIFIGTGNESDYEWRIRLNEGPTGLTAPSQLTVSSLLSHDASTTPHHVALIRKDDIIYLCHDGVEQCRIALVGPSLVAEVADPALTVTVANSAGSAITKIDSVRFTKGSSVYDPTSSFTPPSSALTLQLP